MSQQSAFYITNSSSNTVSVVHPVSGAILATIPVGNGPSAIAALSSGSAVYVGNKLDSTVSVISTATFTVAATIQLGNNPYVMVASPDSTKVYVGAYNSSSGASASYVINVATGAVTTLPCNLGIGNVAISPDGTTLFATSGSLGFAYNASTGAAIRSYSISSGSPTCAAVSPDGTKVYFTSLSAGTLYVLNVSTGATIATIVVGSAPNAAAASPDGTKLYVSNRNDNTVSFINASTNSVSGPAGTVGRGPNAVAFSFDSSTACIVNRTDGTINLITGGIISSPITVGSGPFGVAHLSALSPPSVLRITTAGLGGDLSSVNGGTGVQIAPDVGGSPGTYAATPLDPTNADPYSFDVTGLTPYTLYWIRSVATNGSGNSYSPASSYRTLTDIPAVTFGAVTYTTIAVNIPSAYPADITSWDLHSTRQSPPLAVGISPGTVFQDQNLAPGTAYSYFLSATENGTANAQGPIATQNTVSSPPPPPPPPPPTPPSAPAAPTFGPPTTTTAPVILPALPANSSSLNLLRAPDNGSNGPGAFAQIAPGLAGGATFTDTGLSQSTRYWYEAQAVGPGGTATGPYASDMTTAPQTSPPTFSSASVNAAGTAVTWVFADPYAGNTLAPAAPTGLTITVNGVNVPLGPASASGLSVTTPVASGTIAGGQTVLGSYAPGNLTDAASPPNAVAAFSNQPVANNSAVAAPLSVSLTAPAAGATVMGVQAFTAQAAGGVMGVAKVELYVAGTLADSQAAGIMGVYTLHWDTTAAGNGPYAVYAKAYDNAGPPPNTAVSANLSVTATNPDRLGTGYWFSAPLPAAPGGIAALGGSMTTGGSITQAVLTADILPASDNRTLRELFFGVTTNLASTNFEKDYGLVALNEDFAVSPASAQVRVGVKLAQRYTTSAFAFTEQIVKMRVSGGLGTGANAGTSALIWGASGKLYSFDGVSAPALLLDTAPLLLAGETLRDVCAFGGRVFLALSGGPAPLASRLFAYDPAAGDESYTVAGFLGTASALAATATSLYLGTTEGYIHSLSAAGAMKKVCGGTTATLPHGVASLKAVELSAANSSPGVTAVLTDGSAWDLDGSAVYGATQIFLPPDGAAAAACVADMTYLGSAGGGLYGRGPAGFALAYSFPHGALALAGYGGTVYAGLSGDGRLWGKTLSPGAHALAFGPVTDPLGKTSTLAGLTSITSLAGIGTGLYAGGAAGSGEATLYEYQAPAASALGLFGQAFKHPALEVRSFA